MVKLKKKIAVLFVVAIAALVLIPTAFAMTPTSYSGREVYFGVGSYQSYTWTNGYLPGGNCWNTVEAYEGDYNYTSRTNYTLGENSVYSKPFIGGAYHGVGVGTQISYTW